MKEIFVDGIVVKFEDVFSVWNCYKKCVGELKSFKASVDFDEVTQAFDDFYSDFLENESEDDNSGFDGYEELEAIRVLNYPMLRIMLERHPDIFCQLAKKHFLVDLLGFIFYAQENEFKDKTYVVNDVDNISIADGRIIIDGHVAIK